MLEPLQTKSHSLFVVVQVRRQEANSAFLPNRTSRQARTGEEAQREREREERVEEQGDALGIE